MEAPTDEYIDRANVSQSKHNDFYEETVQRLKPFQDRSEIIRKTSTDAAKDFSDDWFDFCYIDARHDYKSVLEDLSCWFSKVKRGGVIAGHDYVDGMIEGSDFGVKKAVNQFFKEHNTPVYSTSEKDFPSWIVIKR